MKLTGENLSKTYPGNVEALKGVTLAVTERDIAVIIGPSGSGKTTLLNLLGTLDNPTAGRVLLDDRQITGLDERSAADIRNRHFGFVFQFFYLLPELTVLENVWLPLWIREKNRGRIPAYRAEAEILLEEFHLQHRRDFYPGQLSGGELQRTAICRSLICGPEIIFADEPTGSIDKESAHILFDLIGHLNTDRGVTFVIVTHNERFLQLSTKVVQLKEGLQEK